MKPMGPIPPEFAGQRGALTIGERSAREWVAEAGSPCFVYDPAIVAARVARFRAAMPGIDLHYAVKANPHATLLAAISAYSITFSGSATGQRYNASQNSVINTYGGGASYFPGNAAGATATGGQYA